MIDDVKSYVPLSILLAWAFRDAGLDDDTRRRRRVAAENATVFDDAGATGVLRHGRGARDENSIRRDNIGGRAVQHCGHLNHVYYGEGVTPEFAEAVLAWVSLKPPSIFRKQKKSKASCTVPLKSIHEKTWSNTDRMKIL